MKWLEEIPYIILIGAALLMAMLPIQPEPHLVEKFNMFREGKLTEWIDIFDVLWHALPTFLLIFKIWLGLRNK